MNTLPVKAFTLAATLSCAFAVSYAQVPGAPPPSALPATPAIAKLPPPPGIPVPPPPPEPLDEVVDVQEQVIRANKQAAAEVQRGQAAQMKVQADLARLHGDFFKWGGSKGARVLVVPAEQLPSETISDLEEDLTVMARVLEKSLDSKDRQPTALGIDVLTFSGGSAQHLYVGGHGAIFNLRVKFPLSAPTAEKTKTNSDDDVSSTWEDAKRDVFGRSGGFEKGFLKQLDGSPKEDYDADKVEKLKDSIVESLKHATHIRHVKPDERVTVVVTTAAGGPFELRIKNTLSRAGVISRVDESREKTRPESVLTIQAKKSDIDAFAKGKLDSDAFRKKVTMMTY